MSQDWDIKKRSAVCLHTERPFEDGEEVYSCLRFGEDGYERCDYCASAWNEISKDGVVSTWKSVYQLPPPKAEEPLKKETAESLLRDLIAMEDETKVNVIYILAVMLERRRQFVERDVQQQDDGTKVRVYEHKDTGEVFLVTDPELKLKEIEVVQEEVVVMLGGTPPGQKKEERPEEETAEISSEGQAPA